MRNISLTKLALLVSVLVLSCGLVAAQTTVFSYQGKLPNSVTPATGSFEMEFRLFDAALGGSQIGTVISVSNVEVKTGSFSVQLDFGAAAFSGADRFIEIGARRQGDTEPFQVIAPRERVLSVPYAIRALSAATADTFSDNCVLCITDAQIQSVDSSKVTGTVANAVNAQNAANATNATNAVNATNASNADTLDNIDSSAFVQTNTTAFIRNQFAQQAANFNINGTGKANIFDATTQYDINGERILSSPAVGNLFAGFNAGNNNETTRENSFFGTMSGNFNTTGEFNSFFGARAGGGNTAGSYNSFFGYQANYTNRTGSFNTAIGAFANVPTGNLTFATTIGANSAVFSSNTIALGRPDGSDKVVIYGLGAAGSTDLCRNASNQISTCSSSLRYKTGVQNFTGGLNIVRRLHPIAFNWINGETLDVGFAAEEVNKIEPLLTTTNSSGEIEGVKYGQITTVLVNAVKEQQGQIESQQEQIQKQQKQIERQQQQIDALKKLVCAEYPKTAVCKQNRIN